MELNEEDLLIAIRKQCSETWDLTIFQEHIIVNLPGLEDDFRLTYNKVKKEITNCVKEHFPDRNKELLFEVRNGSWNSSFKIGKTTIDIVDS